MFFLNGFSPNPNMVIVDWIKKDTVVKVDCGGGGFLGGRPLRSADVLFLSSSSPSSGVGVNSSASSPQGVGGSMARFTIVNDYMYAVSVYAASAAGR